MCAYTAKVNAREEMAEHHGTTFHVSPLSSSLSTLLFSFVSCCFFQGEFDAHYIGSVSVKQPTGNDVCADAITRIKVRDFFLSFGECADVEKCARGLPLASFILIYYPAATASTISSSS